MVAYLLPKQTVVGSNPITRFVIEEIMPEISRFYGIVIFMNYKDHLPPHFHARYQGQEVTIEIQTGIVKGRMSRRALRMLFEWSERYREALMENWERARARQPLEKIPPLV